jgi:glycine dehydrogenase subunit 1
MPFIPHTSDDVEAMLADIGVASIEDLFDEIPQELRCSYFSILEYFREYFSIRHYRG